MKKFLAMALALLMVCVMLPVTAMAANGGVKMGEVEYTTLKEAVDAAPTDGTETTIEFL